MYRNYDPARIVDVECELKDLDGDEEPVLHMLVQRYGPEPYGPDLPLRYRLLKFYQKYAPEKATEVDKVIDMFRGRESLMFKMFLVKYGPEPADPVPRAPPLFSRGQLKSRVMEIYQHFAPERVASGAAAAVLARYAGDEENLVQQLEIKYSLTPEGMANRRRLQRIYEKHCPEKLAQIEEILQRYVGDEANLFEQLAIKYTDVSAADTVRANAAMASAASAAAAAAAEEANAEPAPAMANRVAREAPSE